MSTTFQIAANTPAWDAAWAALAAEIARLGLGDGSDLAQASASGEIWQYMESWEEDGRTLHTFRHREHPVGGLRQLLTVVGG